MSILLPASPAPRVATMRPVTFGGNQEGALGGPTTQINRPGDRYAIDLTIAIMNHADAAIWASDLTAAIGEDARFPIPQPGIDIGEPGNLILVDGSSQSGTTLKLRGFFANYPIKKGQFFNMLHGGRRYVHHVRAPTSAGTDGKATISIWPMLRFLTVDGEACGFKTPSIEGQLVGGERGVTLIRTRAEPVTLSIVERD